MSLGSCVSYNECLNSYYILCKTDLYNKETVETYKGLICPCYYLVKIGFFPPFSQLRTNFPAAGFSQTIQMSIVCSGIVWAYFLNFAAPRPTAMLAISGEHGCLLAEQSSGPRRFSLRFVTVVNRICMPRVD